VTETVTARRFVFPEKERRLKTGRKLKMLRSRSRTATQGVSAWTLSVNYRRLVSRR